MNRRIDVLGSGLSVRLAVLTVPWILAGWLAPTLALAQCPPPPVYCEGWERDSSHREVSLIQSVLCLNSTCPAECSTSPITALPSIRIGSLDHIVLGFSVPDACVPECIGAPPEPCFNVGVSYRRVVGAASESATPAQSCDPTDPFTLVSAGANFSATYLTGGTDNIVISNVGYGTGGGLEDCGAAPTSLRLVATGPTLGIDSQFTFTWALNQVVAYTETRTYTNLPSPATVHITVSNINYSAGTYTAVVPDGTTSIHHGTWGSVKIRYR